MTDNLPKISEAQTIAREAEKIFESLLSSQLWNDIKVPQERDFGLDYRIEAIADVQLKGFRSVPETGTIPVTVATSTPRYWKNKTTPIWFQRVMNLLNSHSIRLVDEQRTWLIHMKEDRDNEVHYYVFEPNERPSESTASPGERGRH